MEKCSINLCERSAKSSWQRPPPHRKSKFSRRRVQLDLAVVVPPEATPLQGRSQPIGQCEDVTASGNEEGIATNPAHSIPKNTEDPLMAADQLY